MAAGAFAHHVFVQSNPFFEALYPGSGKKYESLEIRLLKRKLEDETDEDIRSELKAKIEELEK